MKHEPEQIDDEEHEQVAERVAAIDVAKASGMVCTRMPDHKVSGRRMAQVWQVAATTNAVMTLADELAGLGSWRSFLATRSRSPKQPDPGTARGIFGPGAPDPVAAPRSAGSRSTA